MIGAILGDIIGSIYEHNNVKNKDFPLFSFNSRYTDDSVMTLAVAEAMMRYVLCDDGMSPDQIAAHYMHLWGREYMYAGYAGRFMNWIMQDDYRPYNSYGNGSAMRVSSVPWIFRDDFDVMRNMARATAMPTHDHPEGIKGADAIASAMGLALLGESKETIRAYIEKEFNYDLQRNCDEIRPTYKMNPTCQGSVPEAIIAFLDGNDYEDVVRNAVSIGGDSDTIAAIAGGIAEAYFGIPDKLATKFKEYLTREQLYIVDCFNDFTAGDNNHVWDALDNLSEWRILEANNSLDNAIIEYRENSTEEKYIAFLEQIRHRLNAGHICGLSDIKDKEGNNWVAIKTRISLEESYKQKYNSFQFTDLKVALMEALNKDSIEGVVINPGTDQMGFLSKGDIREVFRVNELL